MTNEFIDIHCHLLPNLDEGPSTPEESVKMLQLARADGIAGVVATPHIIAGLYNNTKEIIDSAITELKTVTNHVPLYSGAEIRIGRDLVARVAAGDLPLINNKKFLLLELPAYVIPPVVQLENIVKGLVKNRIFPILAHPERNVPILKDFSIMERLIKCGALFQVTAMSITDRNMQRVALKMIEKGYVHAVASDAHDSQLRPPLLSSAFSRISREFGEDEGRRLFIDNPGKIIRGETVC